MADHDDFTVKPLTSGLGFNKKSDPIKLTVSKVQQRELSQNQNTIQNIIQKPAPQPQFTNRMESPAVSMQSPLQDNTSASSIEQTKKELDGLLKALDSINNQMDFDKNLDFISEPAITDEVKKTNRKPHDDRFLSPEPLGYIALDKIKTNRKTRPSASSTVERQPSARLPTHSLISTPEGTVKRPIVGLRRSAADNPPPVLKLKPISINIMADIIDCLLIMATAVCFSFLLIKVLEILGQPISLMEFFTNPNFYFKSLAILVLSHQVYLIATRVFCGSTVGEWTADCQLGNIKQRKSSDYTLKVLFRSLILALTGFILLPVLSVIFRKDIAGYLTGLQLYQKEIH